MSYCFKQYFGRNMHKNALIIFIEKLHIALQTSTLPPAEGGFVPEPPAARGYAPKPSMPSGGWGLRFHTLSNSPPMIILGYATVLEVYL